MPGLSKFSARARSQHLKDGRVLRAAIRTTIHLGDNKRNKFKKHPAPGNPVFQIHGAKYPERKKLISLGSHPPVTTGLSLMMTMLPLLHLPQDQAPQILRPGARRGIVSASKHILLLKIPNQAAVSGVAFLVRNHNSHKLDGGSHLHSGTVTHMLLRITTGLGRRIKLKPSLIECSRGKGKGLIRRMLGTGNRGSCPS